MRIFRNVAATATATAVVIGPLIHIFSVGAALGLFICAWLWRFELKAWGRETWRRFLEALRT